MKLKTSFFDATVLKKDITRFFPVWALYLIIGALVALFSCVDGRSDYGIAGALSNIGAYSIIMLCYAPVVALLLYGDLFNSRMCNALHAFPVRREAWFVTHFVSGLLFGLVPTLAIAAVTMPFLGQFWYVALIWWLGMSLSYLFYFGLAAFCMLCVGNRFAGAAVYGIVNFVSLLAGWLVEVIYVPMLDGVRMSWDGFHRFCPAVQLTVEDFFSVVHSSACQCSDYGYYTHSYEFGGFESGWGYLAILAVLGVVLAGAALGLYRRRQLEKAGDFMAFKVMNPIFLTVFTLCCGGFFMLCASLFFSDDATGYIFLALGMILGYFGGRMLLERRVKVFGLKNWGKLAILAAAVLASMLLTALDPFGIATYVPKAEKVEKVYISQSYLSDYRIERLENGDSYAGVYEAQETGSIEAICQIHTLLLAERGQTIGYGTTPVTVHYVLKNGTTVTRSYYVSSFGEAVSKLSKLTQTPQYVFGFDSLEQMIDSITWACYETYYHLGVVEDQQWMEKLVQALYDDCEGGYVRQDYGVGFEETYQLEFDIDGRYYYIYVYAKQGPNLKAWWQEYLAWCDANGIDPNN